VTIQTLEAGILSRGALMVTLIRYSGAIFVLLSFMLGSTPPLRAEVASDFIVKNSHRCGSESCRRDHPPQTIATTGRIVTISATDRTIRVTNSLPPRTGGDGQPKSTSSVKNAYEYTIVTTGDTVFQDGVDVIRFEDFKSGETISIHGVLKGTTLTASRLAKWE
jgi:hypothetical protein